MMGVLFLGLKWCGLLLGVALLLRLLIPVKLQRRTCRRCAYDMTGIETRTCPECGKQSRNETKLWRKPVRKRHLALLLALFAMTYAGYTGERVLNHNWTAGVPSTALILAMPKLIDYRGAYITYLNSKKHATGHGRVKSQVLGPKASDLLFALEERAKGDRYPMWSWQRRMLRTRAADLGPGGTNLLRDLGGWEQMTDSQRDLLLDRYLNETLIVRKQNPAGHPFYLSVLTPPVFDKHKTRLEIQIIGEQFAVTKTERDQLAPMNPISLGILDSEASSVELNVEFTVPESDYTWSRVIQTGATVAGDIDDVLPPLQGDALDQWLQRWAQPLLQMIVRTMGDDPPRLEVGLILLNHTGHVYGGHPQQAGPFPQDAIGVSLNVDLLLVAGETIVGQGHTHSFARLHPRGQLWIPIENRTAYLRLNPEAFWDAIEQATPLTVRIRSRPAADSLRALEATSRWEGEMEIPLASIYTHDATIRSGNQQAPPIELRRHTLMHLNQPLHRGAEDPTP